MHKNVIFRMLNTESGDRVLKALLFKCLNTVFLQYFLESKSASTFKFPFFQLFFCD
jgi:hypothetical protein